MATEEERQQLVREGTAILNDPLAEVAALRAQLQQAEAALLEGHKDLKQAVEAGEKLMAERDAATKRAEAAETKLAEETEFWVDNVQEVLDTALRVGAKDVVRVVDEFYSTSEGEKRLQAESEVGPTVCPDCDSALGSNPKCPTCKGAGR